MNWSAKTWEASKPVYNDILELDFIKELMQGDLALEKFQFYIAQDAIYLEHFARALALIAARAHRVEDALAFTRFAEGAIVVENALHDSYFKDFNIQQTGIGPTCHHYIHFLKSTASLDAVEVAMAAVLPCFWIYKEVGDYIYANQHKGDNPYQKWIDTYAGEEFGVLVQQAISICDHAAAQCTPAQQEAMTVAFVTASKLEWQFWQSAYDLHRW
ncbi:MAG: thiaminase II [Filimonas sp.]|nr:thiaminase II [Filimonas sp.]